MIDYRDRPDRSESKLNTYSDGLKVLRTIFRLYRDYRPMGFFSWLAVVLILLAAFLFIPVFAEFMQTGLALRFPTLIVSEFIAIAAIQSFFAGLILSSIVMKEKREFEFRLKNTAIVLLDYPHPDGDYLVKPLSR